jgi:hypothetical protein
MPFSDREKKVLSMSSVKSLLEALKFTPPPSGESFSVCVKHC